MSRQVGRVNQQSKGESPLMSGVLQRAAVRAVGDKEGEATQEVDSGRGRESRFRHDFSQVGIDRGSLPIEVSKKDNKTGLPDDLKVGVENLSGYSLSKVKVHYNSPKPAQIQSLAYTRGTEIHVGPGEEEHLPHEAWHVVQQMQGRVQPTKQMKGGVLVNDEEWKEKEADVMGAKASASAEQLTGGKEEEKILQGKFDSGAAGAGNEKKESLANRNGLPDNRKSGVELLSGMSLDKKKVHYQLAQPAQHNALANAQSSDIHVAPGKEQKEPNEALHIVQQAQGGLLGAAQLSSDPAKVSYRPSARDEMAISQKKEDETRRVGNLQRHPNVAIASQPTPEYGGTAKLKRVSERTRSRRGHRAPQPASRTRLQDAAPRTQVVQRKKYKLGIKEFKELNKIGKEMDSFAAYVRMRSWTYEEKQRILDTGKEEIDWVDIVKGYKDHLSQPSKKKDPVEAVTREEYRLSQPSKEKNPVEAVTREEYRSFGEKCVRTVYQGRNQIHIVDQKGKNNCGIYQVITQKGEHLIVKVLGPSYRVEGLVETKKTIDGISNKYSEAQKNGKFEINKVEEIIHCSDGRVSVSLAVYKQQGVMSLEDAMGYQDLPLKDLEGAARGLAERTARFHFAPIAENDQKEGRYMYHGDLNTTNIMLDYDGIMGLIDNDNLTRVNERNKVIWDVNTLLSTLKGALTKRYPPNGVKDHVNVVDIMANAFKSQYKETMLALKVPEREKIAKDMK